MKKLLLSLAAFLFVSGVAFAGMEINPVTGKLDKTGTSSGGTAHGWTTDSSTKTTTTYNVGIGTNNPIAKLEVNGSVSIHDNLLLNDSTVTIEKVSKPSGTSISLNGAGSLTGTYIYGVSYITSQGETSLNLSGSVVAASNTIRVNLPVSLDSRVTGRKIYRTLAGGSYYYYLTTVSNNTDTTYDDTASDNSISANELGYDFAAGNSDNTTAGHFYKTVDGLTYRFAFIGETNTSFGHRAGNNITTTRGGFENTAFGYDVLANKTNGQRNTGVGYNSLNSNQKGSYNTAVGSYSLTNNVSTSNNVALGYANTRGGSAPSDNTAAGNRALYWVGSKEIGIINTITDYSGTVAGTVKVNDTSHGLKTGQQISIYGTIAYDGGPFTITKIDADNFYYTQAYKTDTTGGVWKIYLTSTGNQAFGKNSGADITSGSFNVFLGWNSAYYDWGVYTPRTVKNSGCIGTECQVGLHDSFVFGGGGSTTYGGQNYKIGINQRRPIYDITFGGTADRTIGVFEANDNVSGSKLTLQSGSAGITGAITSIAEAPTAGGTNYVPGDVLTVSTGGSGATVIVDEISTGGVVTKLILGQLGSGYTTGAGKSTTGGSGSGCTVNISTVKSTTDKNAGTLEIKTGQSAGTGSGNIDFYTTPSGSTGTTMNTQVLRGRWLGSGNLGIGTTSPNYLLEVNGSLQADDIYSGDGTQGTTATCSTSITAMTIKDGLITSVTCP